MRDAPTGAGHGGVAVFGPELLLDEHDRLARGEIELVEETPGAAADHLAAHSHFSLGIGPGRGGKNEIVRRDTVLAELHQARVQERGKALQELPIFTGQAHGHITPTERARGL